jgi:uncharacterized OsmC-like protein
VEVIQKKASAPSRVEEFLTRVILPAGLDDDLIPVIERVIHTCPAHNTLKMGAEVNVELAAVATV